MKLYSSSSSYLSFAEHGHIDQESMQTDQETPIYRATSTGDRLNITTPGIRFEDEVVDYPKPERKLHK